MLYFLDLFSLVISIPLYFCSVLSDSSTSPTWLLIQVSGMIIVSFNSFTETFDWKRMPFISKKSSCAAFKSPYVLLLFFVRSASVSSCPSVTSLGFWSDCWRTHVTTLPWKVGARWSLLLRPHRVTADRHQGPAKSPGGKFLANFPHTLPAYKTGRIHSAQVFTFS